MLSVFSEHLHILGGPISMGCAVAHKLVPCPLGNRESGVLRTVKRYVGLQELHGGEGLDKGE